MAAEPTVVTARRDGVVAAVVNFNNAAMTIATVRSLLAVDDIDVMVIDNGSERQDSVLLDQLHELGVDVVRLPTNRGYAAAGNAAAASAAAAGYAALWLLNNDLRFDAPTADRLHAVLMQPRVAAVAPVTVADTDPARVLGAGVDVNLTLAKIRHRFAGATVDRLPVHPYEADALEGAAIMFRLEALSAIGPLDERFFMYWEDTEWSIRASRRGWRVLVVPTARIRHAVSKSTQPPARISWLIGNRFRFSRATASRLQQAIFVGYMLGGWLPAYAVARLIPQFGWRTSAKILRNALGGLLPGVRS